MTKNSIKLSILVPIYNVAPYLEECLQSIQNQSFRDFEVLCLNDGSTDASPEIIQRFVKSDARFKMIDKANSGYGDSMNKGLEKATGDFIGIVESDDFIHPDMFKTLYDLAIKHDVQVVKSNAYLFWTDTNKVAPLEIVDEKHLHQVIHPVLNHSNIFYKTPSIWAAIYKRDFLKQNHIKFLPTKGASYQDTSFNFKVWLCAERVYFTDQAFLYYRQDNAASSMNNAAKKAPAIFKEFDEIIRFTKAKHPELMDMIYERDFTHAFNFSLHMRGRDSINFAKQIAARMPKYQLSNKLFISRAYYIRYRIISRHIQLWSMIKNINFVRDKIKSLLWKAFPFRGRIEHIKNLKRELQERQTLPAPIHPTLAPFHSDSKISVIVLTHNDGKVLTKCIEAIRRQSHKNLEIFIVNDGDEPASTKIIQSLSQQDQRIKVFNSNGQGIAAARNIGLKHSTAPYIMWCDADDLYAPTMCSELLKALQTYKSDFAVSATKVIFEKNFPPKLKKDVEKYLRLHAINRQVLNDYIILTTNASLWNKIYKREIVEKHKITFPTGLYFEDAYFNDIYMLHSDSGYYLNKTLYTYYRHFDSVMTSTFKGQDKAQDFIEIAFKLHEYMQNNNLFGKHQVLFWERYCQHLLTTLENSSTFTHAALRPRIKKLLRQHRADLQTLDPALRKKVYRISRLVYSVPFLLRRLYHGLGHYFHKITFIRNRQLQEIAALEEQIYQIAMRNK